MKTVVAILALALLAIAAPHATAQNVQGITLDADDAGTIPFEGSGEIAFDLDVGCAELLAAGSASPTATVTITDAPVWLNFTPAEVAFGPAAVTACASNTGRVAGSGTVPITVSAAAPAVVQHVVTLEATLGDSTPAQKTTTLSVAYQSDYSVVPSVTFPLTVTNATTKFTVTGTQASNAPSMIMVDAFSASNGALVSGFGALQYLNDGGKPDTKTYNIVFTAPTTDWETATITLKVYGHYNFPDGSAAGEPTDHKTLTWEIVNGGVKPAGGEKGKDSPAPVAMVTALGLLGFAALRRRRE